ncbi:MAG: glucose-1-phosphate adenylyltransferase subunit GlgD [Erysipelotrichia bacterium]|nr:glucose-1-phosphate adenylyltransferase subunit GlgD [Erysipelotrichia bacterium]
MANVLGIVNFENNSVVIEGLSKFRTIPAISFLGRYRVIDFVLSNFVNSHINQIKILIKDKPRSLIEHIGGGTQYNINSKTGSLQILYSDHQIVNRLYFTDIALIKQYRQYIENNSAEYVVIAPSYMICKIDYQNVIHQHKLNNAEVTCVYKSVDDADVNFIGCQEVYLSDNGKIDKVKVNHGGIKKKDISLESYVFSKDTLLKIIDNATEHSSIYSFKTYFENSAKNIKMYGYKYEGYLSCINSLRSYFETSMELIDQQKAKELFAQDWPIYTKTNDSVPAFYSKSAHVKNCLIANGCVVQGELENCILGRGVKIKKGARLKNSVILPNAIIGEDSVIEYTVVDKSAKTKYVKEIIGDADNILYIKRGDTV